MSPQQRILGMIDRGEHALTDIYRRCGMPPQDVQRTIAKLEHRGLVTYVVDPHNGHESVKRKHPKT